MIDGIKPSAVKDDITDTKPSSEPAFVPPEAVKETPEQISEPKKPGFAESKPPKKKHRFAWFTELDKKQKALIIALVVALLGGSGTGVWALTRKPAPAPAPEPVAAEAPVEEPKETPIFSPLTGAPVTKEQSELPIIGVMVENSPDARPQAGLNQAGVVFEAIAEGGITRFLTLWQETQPDYVGPVRSVRPYYLDWMLGFDAAIAHAGGSAEALQRIKNENIKDLDQFGNSGPYRRVSNRYAPHNLYTSIPALVDLSKSKGWTKSTFTGFPRKAEAPSSSLTARVIDMKLSGRLYDIHYDYDAATNSYKRVLAGKPHVDERSKEQLSPKVVIAMVIPYSISGNGIHSVYQTIGTGKAQIFQDGIVTEATWSKPSAKDQVTFTDATGKAVPINAGQTWLTAVSVANNITYGP